MVSQAATVRAGEKGVDFSWAKPPANRLLELGFTFVVGYLSTPPSDPRKNLNKDHCDIYVDAGIKVLLVWEQTATRASLGGAFGRIDGTTALALAAVRGYPVGVPILVADDTNTVKVNIDQHEAYMRAFAKACAPYSIGIYGDVDILERCKDLWEIGWLPNAWSWSGGSRLDAETKARALGVQVLQRKGYHIDNTWAVDPNEAIADFPAWGLASRPPPPPDLSGDDDMQAAFLEVDGLPGQYLWTPGSAPIPFTNPTDRDVILKALGIDPNSGGRISREMFDRLHPPATHGDRLGSLSGTIHMSGDIDGAVT